MSAREQAIAAREQAIAAEEERKRVEAAEKAAEEARKEQMHRETAEAGIARVAEWFPGVDWGWMKHGDYSYDTLIYDASESWPFSFWLKVSRWRDIEDPESSWRLRIEVGDYRADTSRQGYRYFQGVKVNSAAEVGAWILAHPDGVRG